MGAIQFKFEWATTRSIVVGLSVAAMLHIEAFWIKPAACHVSKRSFWMIAN
jgi:hypothetical protein